MAQSSSTSTHWDIKVRCIAETRRFYAEDLGFQECRVNQESWRFTLNENTIVCHLDPRLGIHGKVARQYDFAPGKINIVPHCFIELGPEQWAALKSRLNRRRLKQTDSGESRLLVDPSGNAIVFALANKTLQHHGRWWQRRIGLYLVGLAVVGLLTFWLVFH